MSGCQRFAFILICSASLHVNSSDIRLGNRGLFRSLRRCSDKEEIDYDTCLPHLLSSATFKLKDDWLRADGSMRRQLMIVLFHAEICALSFHNSL